MGVPALFRWLSKKYPRIVEHVEEEEPKTAPNEDGEEEELPIDMSGPNPNGREFDCLYLDFNGIVHPCTHPEGKPAPETEEEMMAAIFEYTERVVNMVRPRKLLMITIDGVAPRAKMNQQRSRRFRAAQEAKEKEEEMEKALEEWKARGIPVTDEAKEKKKPFDSNSITPGTPFQELLTSSLKYWIAKKLNQDPGWKNLQVVLSDSSSPGEGEHKIMDHIRRQRSHAEYDANTSHVIYGLDADLIMLSLATHEPHFKVLREDVFAQDPVSRQCHRCGKEGHIAANCIGEPKEKSGEHDEIGAKKPEKKPFIFLDVSVLREYLSIELNVPGLGFPFSLERAIDDWVFLIFLTGNDFLPHAPSLEIREGAIDNLLKIWKGALPRMGGYLTNHGKVAMENAQYIFDGLAAQEDDIFRRRKEQEDRQEANAKRRKVEDEDRQRRDMAMEKFQHGEQTYVETRVALTVKPDAAAVRKSNLAAAEKLKAELAGSVDKKSEEKTEDADVKEETTITKNEEENGVAVTVKEEETASTENGEDGNAVTVKTEKVEETPSVKMGDGSTYDSGVKTELLSSSDEPYSSSIASSKRGSKRAFSAVDDAEGEVTDGQEAVDPVTTTFKQRKINPDGTVDMEDTVQLWEPGYRERYYRQKFGVELSDTEFRRGIVKSYVEGLCWVLEYYYHGCPSWTWYYPYHFAPFAADFTDLASLQISFTVGKPFRPYDQLMGVLPAASRASIPPIFHPLMTEPDSEIIDFYPETFEIDPNGKKMAWQGVALLPFIDETRLLTAINSVYHKLSEDEVRRNGFGDHSLMVAEENLVYDDLCGLYAKRGSGQEIKVPLNGKHSQGILGFVRPDPSCVPGSTYYSPLTAIGLNDLINDRSISALYEFPDQKKPHKSILLPGVTLPAPVLTEEEREATRRGGRGGGRGGRGGGRGSYNHHSHNADYRSAANGHGAPGANVRLGNGPMRGGGPPRGGGGAPHASNGDYRGGPAAYGGPAYGGGAYGGGAYGGGSYNGGAYNGGAYGGGYANDHGSYPAPPPSREPYRQEPQGGYRGNAYMPPARDPYAPAAAGNGYGAPYVPPHKQPGHANYGGYGGGAYAPPAAPYGQYGQQQRGYGAPPAAAAPQGNWGGYGAPQPHQAGPPRQDGPPKPLGYRSSSDIPPSSRGGRGAYR